MDGLMESRVREFSWSSVNGWVRTGGAEIGTRRNLCTNIDLIVEGLKKYQFHALIAIGGFEVNSFFGQLRSLIINSLIRLTMHFCSWPRAERNVNSFVYRYL